MPVPYFDKQSLPQGVFWLSFWWGGGGSFKLNKNLGVWERALLVLAWVFLLLLGWGGGGSSWSPLPPQKALNFIVWCFIFNPETLYREDRKISSAQCSLEYKTLWLWVSCKLFQDWRDLLLQRLECRDFSLSLYTNHCSPPPPPQYNVPNFFSLFEKVGTDSSW